MKPTWWVPSPLDTVYVATHGPATALPQRTVVCSVTAGGVGAEAMVALVLARACLEKFGVDSVAGYDLADVIG